MRAVGAKSQCSIQEHSVHDGTAIVTVGTVFVREVNAHAASTPRLLAHISDTTADPRYRFRRLLHTYPFNVRSG